MIGYLLLLGAVALTCYVALQALRAVIDKSKKEIKESEDERYFDSSSWAWYLRLYGDGFWAYAIP